MVHGLFSRGQGGYVRVMGQVSQAYEQAQAEGRIKADPAQAAIMPALDRVALALAQPARRGIFRKPPPPVRGLYLWGGVGRGKSMLMDLLFAQVALPKERQHFHAFMQWVHTRMDLARKTGVDDAIAPVAAELAGRVRFLAFDEMQITDIADAMIVGRLFEKLFAAGVTVVTTSNRHPDDLYKNGLNRQLFLPFIAMLKDRLDVIELASQHDHRLGRLNGVQTYFTPVDAAAIAAVEAIWQDMSGDDAAPLVLEVKGRKLRVPAFSGGVARMRFYDLCGQPLGAADYLALAAVARILILEDIPQMSRENFNEARRFVTLVDALYEAKVRLICTAHARPDRLYVDGEGLFEFERTASRLIEMQSADWAADRA